MQAIDYDGFAAHLLRSGRRGTTIKRHLNTLRALERRSVLLEKSSLETFLVKLKSEGKRGSYLNSYVFATKLYGDYIGVDLKLKEFKREPVIKGTLSDDEIEAFLALRRRKNQPEKYFVRLSMFWKIVAFTGMRPGEVAVLMPKHFDWGRNVIIIETSKTNQPGQVPIPANIKSDIEFYLANLKTGYLFPSARGGASYQSGMAVLDNVAWHYDWILRLKALGIPRRIGLTPYSFRHSYATRLLEEEVSLFHVKKLMRHSDLKSTLVYEHLTTKDLIKAQNKLPLIRRGTNPQVILQGLVELVKNFHLESDNRFIFSIKETENSLKFECQLKQ